MRLRAGRRTNGGECRRTKEMGNWQEGGGDRAEDGARRTEDERRRTESEVEYGSYTRKARRPRPMTACSQIRKKSRKAATCDVPAVSVE